MYVLQASRKRSRRLLGENGDSVFDPGSYGWDTGSPTITYEPSPPTPTAPIIAPGGSSPIGIDSLFKVVPSATQIIRDLTTATQAGRTLVTAISGGPITPLKLTDSAKAGSSSSMILPIGIGLSLLLLLKGFK